MRIRVAPGQVVSVDTPEHDKLMPRARERWAILRFLRWLGDRPIPRRKAARARMLAAYFSGSTTMRTAVRGPLWSV